MKFVPNPPLDEVIKLREAGEDVLEHYDFNAIRENEEYLEHYGIKRRSGRYPYGSGDDPYQHEGTLAGRVKLMKQDGMSETDIAKALNIVDSTGKPSATILRAQLSIEKDDLRIEQVKKAESLREKGLSLQKIAEEMGFKNDSSVRTLLDPVRKERNLKSKETADFLKEKVKEKGLLDVGKDVNIELNVSKEMLDQALVRLQNEGYQVFSGRIDQITNPGRKTTMKVLGPPGTKHKDIFNPDEVHSVQDYISRDGGQTFEKKFTYPKSMDSKRLMIRYADDVGPDGVKGIQKDGVIELRRGVQDLDLGGSHYSQVRILVDDNKYLKGMAVYSDNMPDGVDVIFNTNKTKDVAKMDVLKDIKNDPDNPFGSAIKDVNLGGQYWYTDKKTGKKELGLINKRADEGDWSDWKDKLPSQFLSKQTPQLAKQQLKLAIDDKVNEFNTLKNLTNPTVKKQLLETYANDCDSAAVHLYAAALPRQKYHVILPVNSLKDTEIYAPNYNTGERVALVRYPHGGTFEIPILTVNNNNPQAKRMLGNTKDGVGITSKIAERLSGADFDGDTVMVIPTNDKVRIKSSHELEDLKDYDPKIEYGTRAVGTGKKDPKTGKEIKEYYNKYGEKVKIMANTQNEMGRISNLITDMTLKGATEKELARAVRHSMTVIDAEKHKLDYKTSYVANGIEALKKKYQTSIDPETGKITGGASTLISRAKSETSVDKRQGSPKVNIKGSKDYDPSRPEGALLWKTSDRLYHPEYTYDKKTGIKTMTTKDGKKIRYSVANEKDRAMYDPVEVKDPKTGESRFFNKSGDIEYRVKKSTIKSTKMAETDDANTLVSDRKTAMELLYADYANKMKSLANEARKEMVITGNLKYNSNAKSVYADEVASLDVKLKNALKNSPRERQAQLAAKSEMNAKKQANPDMTKSEEKKLRDQALKKAREKFGAKREPIEITDKEWEAIQAGAITNTKLKSILANTDVDKLREKATPRTNKALSKQQLAKIKSMASMGYSNAQIAKQLGLSASTVSKYIKD